MDLEQAYDRTDREVKWNVLQLYGVRENLLNTVKRIYDGSKGCIIVVKKLNESFLVRVGLRKECIMSPW